MPASADVSDSRTAMVAMPPAPAERFSVYADSDDEALKFKWIESEKAGYDLGEEALRRWVQRFWPAYLRARLIEHLEGKRFWSELDRGDFGLLRQAFHDDPCLLDRIIARLKEGAENLNIVVWAFDCDLPICRVHEIMTSININSRRLKHRFDPDHC